MLIKLNRRVLMKGSLKRSMGKPLKDKNKRAYFGPERLPGRPDGDSAGRRSAGLLNDPTRSATKSFSERPVCSSERSERARDSLLISFQTNTANRTS